MSFFSSDGRSIILGIFDGHGKEGEHLVNTCIKEADDYFHKRMAEYDEKPTEFLNDLLQKIIKTLTGRNFDIKSSGCSCVLALIHNDHLYTINLGNFKSSIEVDQRHVTAMQMQELNPLKDLSKRRRSSLTRQPFAFQLSKDHVTSNQKEFMRILKAGGNC